MPLSHRTPGRTRHAAGFTLLELAIVMIIITVVTGGSIGMFIVSASSRRLKRAGAEIEVLAKRAHAAAVTRQAPYALVFRPHHVELLLLAATNQPANADIPPAADPDSDQAAPRVATGSFDLDDDMSIAIRRWASRDFITLGEKDTFLWRFDPDGLCEPVTLRVELGSDWLEETFHPLTGSVKDSSMEAK